MHIFVQKTKKLCKTSWILLTPFPLVEMNQIEGGKLSKGRGGEKRINFSLKVIVLGQGH